MQSLNIGDYYWAKDSIFRKFKVAMDFISATTPISWEQIFKPYKHLATNTLSKDDFLTAIKSSFSTDIAPEDMERLATQLADPVLGTISPANFVKLYQQLTSVTALLPVQQQRIKDSILKYFSEKGTSFEKEFVPYEKGGKKYLNSDTVLSNLKYICVEIQDAELIAFLDPYRIASDDTTLDYELFQASFAEERPNTALQMQRSSASFGHKKNRATFGPSPLETPSPASTIEQLMDEVRKAALYNGVDVEQAILQKDPKANAGLLFKTFDETLRQMQVKLPSESAQKLFTMLDDNGDMKVTIQEFSGKLESLSANYSGITPGHPMSSLFYQIRSFLKENRGSAALVELFEPDTRQNASGGGILQYDNLRRGLSKMKLFFDEASIGELLKFLDYSGKGYIEFNYLCDKIGYIQCNKVTQMRPHTGGRGMLPSATPFEPREESKYWPAPPKASLERQFIIPLIKKLNGANLAEDFNREDPLVTGELSHGRFKMIVEKYMGSLHSGIWSSVALAYGSPGKTGSIDYKQFLLGLETSAKYYGRITQLMEELYKRMKHTRYPDLYSLLKNYDKAASRKFSLYDINDMLFEFCGIRAEKSESDYIVSFFDSSQTGNADYELLESDYKEFAQAKDFSARQLEADPMTVIMNSLKERCEWEKCEVESLFKGKENTAGMINKFELIEYFRDLCKEKLSEKEIVAAVAQLSGNTPQVNLKLLYGMYRTQGTAGIGIRMDGRLKREAKRQLLALNNLFTEKRIYQPETIFLRYDAHRNKTIAQSSLGILLAKELNLVQSQIDMILKGLLPYYDPQGSGVISYQNLLYDMTQTASEQKKTAAFYNQLNMHCNSRAIQLYARFKALDPQNTNFLPKAYFSQILDQLGFPYDPAALECALNQFEPNYQDQINYLEFENTVKNAVFQEEALASGLNTKLPYGSRAPLTPTKGFALKDMLNDIAVVVVRGKIQIFQIMSDRDTAKSGKIFSAPFLDILASLSLSKYNKYDFQQLAKAYETPPMSDEIDYSKFIADLTPYVQAQSNQSVIKTNMSWANKIYEDMAVALYCLNETSFSYFQKFGLNQVNMTMSYGSFVEAIKNMKFRIKDRELSQLARDLDTYNDGSVSIQELTRCLETKQAESLADYERQLFRILIDFVENKHLDVVTINKGSDPYNNGEVNIVDFKRNLRLNVSSLDEYQCLYLARKYDAGGDKVSYKAFSDDLGKRVAEAKAGTDATQKGLSALSEDKWVLDKLRDGIQRYNVFLSSKLRSKDKDMRGTLSTVSLKGALPREVLTEDDFLTLCKILDPERTGNFDYQALLIEMWTDDKEELERRHGNNSSEVQNKKLSSFLTKNRKDLEGEFVKMDVERSGFLTPEQVKQAFYNLGMPLSNTQLLNLLYYQNIQCDALYRKNYIEILSKIFNKAASVVDRMKTLSPMGDPLNKARSEFVKKNTEPFGRAAANAPPNLQALTLRPSQENLLLRILAACDNNLLSLSTTFKQSDPKNSQFLERYTFFYNLNYALSDKTQLSQFEENEVMALPGVSPDNANVSYPAFLDHLAKTMEKHKGASVAPGSSQVPTFKKQRTEAGIGKRVAHFIKLDKDGFEWVSKRMEQISSYFMEKKINFREKFERFNESRSGFITIDEFCQSMHDCGIDLKDEDTLNYLYSYLKEEQEQKVSLKRLYDALTSHTMYDQYLTAENISYQEKLHEQIISSNVHLKKLADFITTHGIKDEAIRSAMPSPSAKTLSKTDLASLFKNLQYAHSEEELDLIFNAIDIKHDGNGSFPKLMGLIKTEIGKTGKPKKKIVFEPKVQASLNTINKELQAKKITAGQLYEALDLNGDGYIDKNEFAQGLSKFKLSISFEDLMTLFYAIDVDGSLSLSINEISLYVIGAKLSANERMKEIGIDEQIKLEIDKLFSSIDKDGDGKIGENEFFMALNSSSKYNYSREKTRELLKALDKDGNGTIERAEFLEFMESQIKKDILNAEDEMTDLRAKFKEYDLDGSGTLTITELYELLRKQYPKLKMSDIEALITAMDVNHDGQIDIDEFIGFMSNSSSALEMTSDPQKYQGVLALKAQRQFSPTEFMSYFDNITKSLLFTPSFMNELHTHYRNLPSEIFTLMADATGLGYQDIKPIIGPNHKPTRNLMELKPEIGGYIIFKSGNNIPVPDPAIVSKENILARSIKIGLYDTKMKKFVYNTGVVMALYSDSYEYTWSFNKPKSLGTNPVAFKWGKKDNAVDIDVVFELVISVRKNDKLLELSNGWGKIELLKCLEAGDKTIKLKSGNPSNPVEVDEEDSRADKEGLFAKVKKDVRSKNTSPELVISVRLYSNLYPAKQKYINMMPTSCLINKKLLPFCAMYRKYAAEVLLGEQIQHFKPVDQDYILSTFPSVVDNQDILAELIPYWDAVFQNFRKNESELMAKFKEFMQKLYWVIKSVGFAWDFANPMASARGNKELYAKRQSLMKSALALIAQRGAKVEENIMTIAYTPFRIEELFVKRMPFNANRMKGGVKDGT